MTTRNQEVESTRSTAILHLLKAMTPQLKAVRYSARLARYHLLCVGGITAAYASLCAQRRVKHNLDPVKIALYHKLICRAVLTGRVEAC